jgi:hypothetical protein
MIQKVLKRLKLNPSEIFFLKTIGAFIRASNLFKSSRDVNSRRVLIQIPADYYYMALFFSAKVNLAKDNPTHFFGLWHYNIVLSPIDESLQWMRHWGRALFNLIDRYKWTKLHNVPIFEGTFSLSVGMIDALRNRWRAYNLWRSLKTKQDVLNIRFDGTVYGDLIYDTYLRFRVQPTVELTDWYLYDIIRKCLDAQVASRKFLLQRKIDLFLSSYASYVQHGVPVREALKLGIKVYTAGTLLPRFKQLSLSDTSHTPAHWLYQEEFRCIENSDAARAEAKFQLESRFKGGRDLATVYMKDSAFSSNDIPMPSGIDGVIFLHDFFDNPHCYRYLLFEDYWEWIIFTFSIIRQHRLNIAVKAHPNELPESARVVAQLKKLFPDIQWLDKKISNKTIFKSGIKCGISVCGTVIHELAYHGIAALAAGDHPHIAFDIAITPKSKQEYEQCLINYRQLTPPGNAKEQVLEFYYMHVIAKHKEPYIMIDDYDFRRISQHNEIGSLERFAIEYVTMRSKL